MNFVSLALIRVYYRFLLTMWVMLRLAEDAVCRGGAGKTCRPLGAAELAVIAAIVAGFVTPKLPIFSFPGSVCMIQGITGKPVS